MLSNKFIGSPEPDKHCMPGQPIPADLHGSRSHLPGRCQVLSQAVSRAVDSSAAPVEDMCIDLRIDHGRADVPVEPQPWPLLSLRRHLAEACPPSPKLRRTPTVHSSTAFQPCLPAKAGGPTALGSSEYRSGPQAHACPSTSLF